jgi:hypothetical protein
MFVTRRTAAGTSRQATLAMNAFDAEGLWD